jgi:hypothetical protein
VRGYYVARFAVSVPRSVICLRISRTVRIDSAATVDVGFAVERSETPSCRGEKVLVIPALTVLIEEFRSRAVPMMWPDRRGLIVIVERTPPELPNCLVGLPRD